MIVAHLGTLPMSFMWVAVGGAILTFRLVQRGEAEDARYDASPFIWTFFSITLTIIIVESLLVFFFCRRASKAKRQADAGIGDKTFSSIEMNEATGGVGGGNNGRFAWPRRHRQARRHLQAVRQSFRPDGVRC